MHRTTRLSCLVYAYLCVRRMNFLQCTSGEKMRFSPFPVSCLS